MYINSKEENILSGNKTKIELKEMPKPENQIEAKESILIKPNIKEKHPLIRNQGDSLMIEGKEKPEEKIQYLDSIKIVLPKKFEEENILIEQGEKIDIIDVVTKKLIPLDSCLNKFVVNVEPYRAIIDINYFNHKIEECVNNRKEEIILFNINVTVVVKKYIKIYQLI